uniref:hypothetical protein n=1 Tax=Bacteroides eggerthii TaxID=28111 RepID=UPI003FEF32BE
LLSEYHHQKEHQRQDNHKEQSRLFKALVQIFVELLPFFRGHLLNFLPGRKSATTGIVIAATRSTSLHGAIKRLFIVGVTLCTLAKITVVCHVLHSPFSPLLPPTAL